MRTLILATSALHFIDAVILASRFEAPYLVFSGYQTQRSEYYLSLLKALKDKNNQIFTEERYHFIGNARQALSLLNDIKPTQIVTGNDYMREFQMLSYVAKLHFPEVTQHYMDDGLSSYNNALKLETLHGLKNTFRLLTKGYAKSDRVKMGCHEHITQRYLFQPDQFHQKDDIVNETIIIDDVARARLNSLAQQALNDNQLDVSDVKHKYDLLLLPNEKTIKDEARFLDVVEETIRQTKAAGKTLLIKAHPSDSIHVTKPFSKLDHVTFLDIRVPAELVLAGIAPEKIYSGHSTIVMTAKLLYPDVEILPI